MKKTASTLQQFLGTSFDSSSSSSTSSNNSNDAVISAELALTFHTVKHNMSYNGMDCGVKLDKIIYVDSKTALNIRLARTKMEALVMAVLGPQAIQIVLDDLKKDVFYCIQSDASNRKNIKLFPLVIQYFTIDNGIQNKLVDFYENPDESADGMFKAIRNSLTEQKIALENISALSADNCNANFGIHHSLFTIMKTVVPDIIKGNCHAHIVHNTVKFAMNCLTQDVENIILKIYSHFSSSAVRREELKKFVASVNGEWHELKRHVGTRWLSLLPCVDNILLNWLPIRDYFVSLEDNCPSILQNILLLNEREGQIIIEIYFHFVSHILHIFNKTVKLLEGNNITILDVYTIMNNLKKELEQRIADHFFGYDTNRKINKIEEKSPELSSMIHSNLLLFIEKSLIYLNKWFDFNSTNWLNQCQILNLNMKIEFKQLENILDSLNLVNKLNINVNDLYSEIIMVNDIISKLSNEQVFQSKNTAEKWQMLFKSSDEILTNIFKIISFLLSIPATSAFTERIFSVMNVKWREERNRASINLIKNELLIYFNIDLNCSDAYNYFKNNRTLMAKAKSNNKYSWKNK